jgi:hypothetical protein
VHQGPGGGRVREEEEGEKGDEGEELHWWLSLNQCEVLGDVVPGSGGK